MAKAIPLLTVRLPRRRKLVGEVFEEVEKAIRAEILEMERTSGRGHWPKTMGRGRMRRPLRGISKHLEFHVQGNTLVMTGASTGKRGGEPFLQAHHQERGSTFLEIVPKRSRVLYLPLTRKAEKLTARQAFQRSSRFGGNVKEGSIIDGVLHFRDPATGKLRRGWPDFLWVPRVRLPRRPLFDKRVMGGVIRRATKKALLKRSLVRKGGKAVIRVVMT